MLVLWQRLRNRELAHDVRVEDSQHWRTDRPDVKVDQSPRADVWKELLKDIREALAMEIAWILGHVLANRNKVSEQK